MSLLISAGICTLLFFHYSSLHQKVSESSLCYLFVGLGEQDAHTLHRQAAVAQRTGVAAVARGRVHALHSGETGVKLALQEKKKKGGHERCWSCKMNVILTGPLHEKAFRSDDTFAHAKKRMLKGRVLGKGVSANTKRQTGKCTRNNPPPVLLSSRGHQSNLNRRWNSYLYLWLLLLSLVKTY